MNFSDSFTFELTFLNPTKPVKVLHKHCYFPLEINMYIDINDVAVGVQEEQPPFVHSWLVTVQDNR